jgi:hypothetical protein
MAYEMRSIPARPHEKIQARDQPRPPLSTPTGDRSVFTWKDFSRFVQVASVERGWLVLWGQYRDGGRSRDLAGQRTYLDLQAVRRRVADSVFELTKSPQLVAEAVTQFDRASIAERRPGPLPDPL